jgi:hypothetical protein
MLMIARASLQSDVAEISTVSPSNEVGVEDVAMLVGAVVPEVVELGATRRRFRRDA